MYYFQNYINFSIFTIVLLLFQLKNVTANLYEIDCSFYRTLEQFSHYFTSTPKAQFYITSEIYGDLEIGPNNWSNLKKSGFVPTKKTVIIIHGWQSDCNKAWVRSISKNLSNVSDVNIILVDWSVMSSSYNYIKVAEDSPRIADIIHEFLQGLKIEIDNWIFPSRETKWNHLYFIGHSVGAHISGRVAYLLKNDFYSVSTYINDNTAHLTVQNDFWKIERITGLDPAKPCFVHKTPDHNRIDKTDADFVDIIHSQTGSTDHAFAFGLKEALGHIDFYMNGGALQPHCSKLGFLDAMICSHKLSYKYFINSLMKSSNKACALFGYKWDETKGNAKKIFVDLEMKQDKTCNSCPEVGINAVKSDKRGVFLVLTSEVNSKCPIYDDPKEVEQAIVNK